MLEQKYTALCVPYQYSSTKIDVVSKQYYLTCSIYYSLMNYRGKK